MLNSYESKILPKDAMKSKENPLCRFCILMFTFFACSKDGDYWLHFNTGVTYLG